MDPSNPKDVQVHLQSLWEKLCESSKMLVPIKNQKNGNVFPEGPGVYCIWEGTKLRYVGETKDLYERMNHIKQTRHHTARRTVGRIYFNAEPGYEPASSKKAFPPHIEEKLDIYISLNLRISFIEVRFGRKELEEYVCNLKLPIYNASSHNPRSGFYNLRPT